MNAKIESKTIEKVTLKKERPLLLRIEVLPFSIGYAVALMSSLLANNFSLLLFTFPTLLFFHLLTFLFRFWSPSFNAFCSTRTVTSPLYLPFLSFPFMPSFPLLSFHTFLSSLFPLFFSFSFPLFFVER